MPAKMNVLIVQADQWRAQACGYAGNSAVRTPRLDGLAAESLNCRMAVSGVPVCTPARASLLTGRYPHRHGLFLNDAPLNPDLPSLGKVFAAAGYRTAWVGKWHVDGHGRHAFIPRERRHGFEYFKALECTHEYQKSQYYDNDDPTLKLWPGYDAFAQTDDLLGWLRQETHRPFLAVLAWGPPHSPYDRAPAEFNARYDPATLPVTPNVLPQKADYVRKALAGYYANCSALDTALGRVLDELERTGLGRDTLVLFMSDHGDMLGSYDLWDKQFPWEDSIRVPMLLRAPGLLRAGVSDVLIDQPDILPTLCRLLDLPIPEGVQGRDLAGHLRAGTVPENDSALLAAYHQFGNWPLIAAHLKLPELFQAREFRGLRTIRYTYCEDRQGPWLLYDNHADPLQQHNLAASAAHQPLRATLAGQLRQRMARVEDTFEPGREMVARWGYQVDATGTIPCPD